MISTLECTTETCLSEDTVMLAAARALGPQVRACAEQIEHDRRLPQPLVDAIAAAGLFKMLVPRALGGGEVSPETFVRVIEEVARQDASTAWCIFLPACNGIAAGSLREDVAWEIFGQEKAYVAASTAPSGHPAARPPDRAVAVDGGYRVTGRWSFASGCMHATWLSGASAIYVGNTPRSGGNGQPEMRLMFFASVTFILRRRILRSGPRTTAQPAGCFWDLIPMHSRRIVPSASLPGVRE